MKTAAILASVSVAISGAHAITTSNELLEITSDVVHAVRRAFPNAPNGYTPSNVTCPSSQPSVRSAADGLSVNETAWLEVRRNYTVDAMKTFLDRLNITGFDAATYISDNSNNATALPNIGIAVSGGGYRAMLNGAGAIKAFDNRTTNATASGHLGGLLQSATYLSGLSGGSWLVGSIYMNNFTTIGALQGDPSDTVWELQETVFEGPAKSSAFSFVSTAEYFVDLNDQVDSKESAGYPTSITDYWGRALGYQLINATAGGVDYTWSSIASSDAFINGETPMPLVVADGRLPDQLIVSLNTTVYEFNPFEFGSHDPTVYGFVPLAYIGSNFTNGSLAQDKSCVRGFDAASFVMGTSSSLFNQFLLSINSTDLPSWLTTIFTDILEDIGEANEDIAEWSPNPFYGYRDGFNPNAEETSLTLVDGGEDLQNIPLHPLIQPVRNVDVIFAVDSSADTDYYWPNGTALVATYERSKNSSGIANGTTFPYIPDVNTFVNLGLNNRPTFFGCDSSNTTSITPIIVYLANAPYIYQSNFSTFNFDYSVAERDDVILNGYNVATMGNATRDSDWPACVGCVILSRSLERTNTTVPDICQTCFENYCWNGTLNSTTPSKYNPAYILEDDVLNVTSAGVHSVAMLGGSAWPSVALAVLMTAALMMI